jgi:hypothetical protein
LVILWLGLQLYNSPKIGEYLGQFRLENR